MSDVKTKKNFRPLGELSEAETKELIKILNKKEYDAKAVSEQFNISLQSLYTKRYFVRKNKNKAKVEAKTRTQSKSPVVHIVGKTENTKKVSALVEKVNKAIIINGASIVFPGNKAEINGVKLSW